MPVFVYKGFDKAGGATAGEIDADNAKAARARLRRQGVFPTEVKEQSGKATSGTGLNMEIDFSQYLERISNKDVAYLTAQLSVLVNASVPLAEAVSALVEQTEKKKLKVVLTQVKEDLNGGSTLADALVKHPKVFDELYVSMVRAGERSGALGEVLAKLSAFADESVKIQGQVVSALAYPVLMAIVGILLLVGIFVGVLPQMRTMFASFGGEENLPTITRVVFFVGDFVVSWGWLIPVVIIGGGYGFKRWLATTEGRHKFDAFMLKAPVLGKMNRMIAISRFCRTLGVLLVSGVPIISALNIVRDVLGNVILGDVITEATAYISEGQSIATPLKKSGQFPPMVIHMIKVGERTGELEAMLNLIADAYESEVEDSINAFTSLLGPLTIMVMGGSVFVVALALLTPMQSLAGSL